MLFANVNGRSAVVVRDRFVDLERASAGALHSDPMDLFAPDSIERVRRVLDTAAEAIWEPVDVAQLLAPAPRPGKILAAALNYRTHAEESGLEAPAEPALFARLPSAIAGPRSEIVLPPGRTQIDWEAEMVLVIGRAGRRIREQDAWNHVVGVTAGQDLSDREQQFSGPSQFTMAKSYDTFAPIGPFVATIDEFADPDALGLICQVNGVEVQRGNTSDLIHSTASLIAHASAVCTLCPGDLIFTGTPAGVGWGMKPPRFLAPGDLVETTLEGVGTMRNRCVEESSA